MHFNEILRKNISCYDIKFYKILGLHTFYITFFFFGKTIGRSQIDPSPLKFEIIILKSIYPNSFFDFNHNRMVRTKPKNLKFKKMLSPQQNASPLTA